MTKPSKKNIQQETEQLGQLTVSKAGFAPLDDPAEISRRRFLEAAGFSLSLAAISGCSRAPVETALPHPIQPVGADGRTTSVLRFDLCWMPLSLWIVGRHPRWPAFEDGRDARTPAFYWRAMRGGTGATNQPLR